MRLAERGETWLTEEGDIEGDGQGLQDASVFWRSLREREPWRRTQCPGRGQSLAGC